MIERLIGDSVVHQNQRLHWGVLCGDQQIKALPYRDRTSAFDYPIGLFDRPNGWNDRIGRVPDVERAVSTSSSASP